MGESVRATHDIAERRFAVLESLSEVLTEKGLGDVTRAAARLRSVVPLPDRLEDNVVLVAYGGGKDSSYTLAFVRAMQLALFAELGATFRLRVVTNRHAGMPRAVLENIDRAYRALGILGDPLCLPLLVDGSTVRDFDVAAPQAPDVVARNRLDILMTGHRTFADARPMFCNSCNLSMINSFGLAATVDGGVNVIVTGDSRQEQRAYTLWVNKLARRFGKGAERRHGDFRGFLMAADEISRSYFAEIHGVDSTEEISRRRITTGVPEALEFFSIYEDTEYSSGDHWELLTEYLGFVFDDFAFSFTESDCGNPALMAHLRGLKVERMYGRDYREGVAEYVDFAISLMRKKEFPEPLIEMMRQRYGSAEAIHRMRVQANDYARDAYNLDEEQLVAMVYSPFAGEGRGLERYLRCEEPDMLPQIDQIRSVLGGDAPASSCSLVETLERASGLELRQLRILYRSALRDPSDDGGGDDLIGSILAGDPHKALIETRRSPDGPVVLELLSGR